MRILIVSPYLPWPIDSGGGAAQFSSLKCLEGDHQFTLVCPVNNVEGLAHAAELQSRLSRVHVRAVYCGNPPDSFFAKLWKRGSRILFRILSKAGFSQARQPDGPARPFYPLAAVPEKILFAVEEELKKGVDLCQVEFALYLTLGAWLPAKLPKLFVHHQVHFIYARRFIEKHGADAYVRYLDSMWRVQEFEQLKAFDGVITFSEDDRQSLIPLLGAEKVVTSPFPFPADVGVARELTAGFDGRFLFLASHWHDPNCDALEWLVKEIWPEVRKQLPDARLVVVGNWTDAWQSKLASPGVEFAGFVEDLGSVLRGGIMLVPLRIGSGIRVKIMVAMAQGVPVVSTTVGCEGMLMRDGQDLLVRDSGTAFAAAAVELARTPALWKELAASGQAAIIQNYSPESVRLRRNQIYNALTRPAAERVVS